MRLRVLLRYWLPAFIWMIFIFVGSTDLMSAEHTSRFIGPFLRWFAPDVAETTIASVQLVVRKGAHLTEYAVLASLLYRAFRQGRDLFGRAAAFSLFIAAVCAALDEFHQSFVSTRTASPFDVAIDIAGALAGALIYWRAMRNRKPKI